MLLSELPHECVASGTVFRVPGALIDPTAADVVDFMLCHTPGVGLFVTQTTGYHAGDALYRLPEEAYYPGTRMIAVAWLKANWSVCISEKCPPDQVHVAFGYPVPSQLTFDEPVPKPGRLDRLMRRQRWKRENGKV